MLGLYTGLKAHRRVRLPGQAGYRKHNAEEASMKNMSSLQETMLNVFEQHVGAELTGDI